jgi:hypothetical protein
VIADWTKDEVINGHYSPHCLRQAYDNVPTDLADYSPILDDISAALLGPTTGSMPAGRPPSSGSGSKKGSNATNRRPSAKLEQKRADQAVRRAGTADSIPDSSHPLPLPLLILGAVTFAALLAAVSPPLIHRLRDRFPRARPAP